MASGAAPQSLAQVGHGKPRRPLEIHLLRRADEEKQRFPTQFELVLQTYVLPLADFVQAAPGAGQV